MTIELANPLLHTAPAQFYDLDDLLEVATWEIYSGANETLRRDGGLSKSIPFSTDFWSRPKAGSIHHITT